MLGIPDQSPERRGVMGPGSGLGMMDRFAPILTFPRKQGKEQEQILRQAASLAVPLPKVSFP